MTFNIKNRMCHLIFVIPFLEIATAEAVTSGTESVFINEIHYDNSGSDQGEAIEIAGPANTDLSGWSLILYNGSSSQRKPYGTIELEGNINNQCNGFGTLAFNRAGIQNGAPDGIALVDNNGVLQQFLSYEGSFTALEGIATGQTSSNIGVSESSSTVIGESLQLSGDGSLYGNFSWNPASTASFGEPNSNQSFNGVACEGSTGGGGGTNPTISKIHQIQGTSDNVIPGEYTVEAIVTGDYQHSTELKGFFVQEEDSDIDTEASSSEGIFIFCNACSTDVNVGDKVQVTGSASDFFGMSQLSASSVTVISSENNLPSPTQINLPVVVSTDTDLDQANAEINAFYEALEGMLVSFNGDLTIDEYFQLSRYGQLVLSEGDRPYQFTDLNFPDENGLISHQINLATRRIILDDNNNQQNSALFNNHAIHHPQPGFSTTNFFRGGDSISNLTGVLHWSWAGSGGTDAWRIRPIKEAYDYVINKNNLRTTEPESVEGNLTIASFNVLNYFTTIDENLNVCGPSEIECRGADSTAELDRQTEKLVAALCKINADIVGLIEIENNSSESLNSLTSALNQSCGQYDFVNTGTIGTDAIKQGLIYKPSSVSLSASFAVLDSNAFTDPNNLGDAKNRPALAQSFTDLSSGEQFTVVVNHFKSKGSSCGEGDDDLTRGQGNCNLTRTLAAHEQINWLSSNPTGSASEKILILGDLNAYAKEDPIIAFKLAGYADLLKNSADTAYSYLFDGQLGTLDYALANIELIPFVSGVTSWHINADEVNVLDYNDTVEDASEASFEAKPEALPLFQANEYRASDHDPVIVGLNFTSAEPNFDLDEDGCVGRDDAIILLTAIRNGNASANWDFNADGIVSRADVRTLMNFFTHPRGVCPR